MDATDFIDIVFDGPPGPEPGRFVEVENSAGASIDFGEWIARDDGYWCLRIKPDERIAQLESERTFPIQRTYVRDNPPKPHPTNIPWSVADLAYSVYSNLYGRGQSLERLAQRSGFTAGEMDEFLPDWRERCDEIVRLKARVAELIAAQG